MSSGAERAGRQVQLAKIEQAKSVLAERFGVTAEEAFEMLRRSARRVHVRHANHGQGDGRSERSRRGTRR